jgi:hypothetical protein
MIDNGGTGDDPLRTVRHLLDAGRGDTLFRDLYLEWASMRLAPVFSPEAFAGRELMKRELEQLLRQNVTALEQGEWPRVRELTGRVKVLQQSVNENAELTELAREVYVPHEVVVDPFSPGLSVGNAAEIRESLMRALEALQGEDPAHAPLYAARKERLAPLQVHDTVSGAGMGKRADRDELRREAIEAAQTGDVARLERLIGQLVEPAGETSAVATGIESGRGAEASLSEAFPEASVQKGEELGFVAAEVDAFPDISGYLHRWAWQPSLPDPLLTQDGHIRIAGVPDDRGYPAAAPEYLRDTLDLFLIHPYINSAGIRYLPLLPAESLLVENFPEEPAAEEGAGIISALGLLRRRGLSRREIERALLRNGPRILRERFALDPAEYRLVCIPPDLYCRLGRRLGWGNREIWTHFDGYQMLKDGGFRALVGGDVRYGGIFDLCSIGTIDEREGVLARFAVVKRERLAAM